MCGAPRVKFHRIDQGRNATGTKSNDLGIIHRGAAALGGFAASQRSSGHDKCSPCLPLLIASRSVAARNVVVSGTRKVPPAADPGAGFVERRKLVLVRRSELVGSACTIAPGWPRSAIMTWCDMIVYSAVGRPVRPLCRLRQTRGATSRGCACVLKAVLLVFSHSSLIQNREVAPPFFETADTR